MKETGLKRALRIFSTFFTFFLLVAFVITCSIMLFVTTMSESLGITLTPENIGVAAKLTFLNAVLISLLFSIFDEIRRRITVDGPVNQISRAAERMAQGDFSVRIQPVSEVLAGDRFNQIIASINRMAEELSGVETLRTDFVSNVSHEMKTPLAVIKNYATLLSSPELAEDNRIEYSTAIMTSVDRLADMMTNILRLNKLENQQIFPTPSSYDLGEQLCECILGFEGEWEKKNIEPKVDIKEGLLIRQDRELLSLVWNNLLSNAFKFTDEGGSVGISLSLDGNDAIVKISDTGCGMTPEVGAHIFEKFYQGDSSRSTAGNGLGLALVKRIVDIIGGEISVEGGPGVGSSFTVRIGGAEKNVEENT